MNCVVFVTVRTTSIRLPKKALLQIKERPLIKILLDRISESRQIKKIVVCTTNQKSDDVLVKFLQSNKIEVFRGDNVDVLNRLYLAAKKYKAKQFVVVEGDDIFCDPELIDKTCKKLSKTDYEFLTWKNLPFGVSPLGIKTNKLEDLIKNKKIKNTETGWGRFIIESGLFKVGQLSPDNRKLIRPEIRLSIDYKEDFQLAKKIIESLPEKFSLQNILNLLDKNPSWLNINEQVKKKYERNFTKKMTKLVLKKENN